jgi:hypothetical protein
MTNFSDVLRVGRAPLAGSTRPGLQGANTITGGANYYGDNNIPSWGRGMQMAPVWGWSVQPIASGTGLLAASQTPAGAGNLTLTAGTGVTTKTIGGISYLILDGGIGHCVTVTTAGDEHTVNMTVTGIDMYYQIQTQTQALPSSATTGATLKAFAGVSSVSVSGATAGAITIGFNDTMGLPYVVGDKTLVTRVAWNNTLAQDTGTLTVADATSPATASTGDVRGTYVPSSGAADGSKRLTFCAFMVNPDKDSTLFGVLPV